MSYLEIYNDRLHDLLEKPGAGGGPAPDFTIVDDPVYGAVVKHLTRLPVATEEECLQALFVGEEARITKHHALNARSNRSHCIFTVHVEQRNRLGGGKERVGSGGGGGPGSPVHPPVA